eukprot:m.82234 g.82234  ORF g.82234 m.82234 type:complete len:150 (+) comp8663_c0_seq8:102-551(+)
MDGKQPHGGDDSNPNKNDESKDNTNFKSKSEHEKYEIEIVRESDAGKLGHDGLVLNADQILFINPKQFHAVLKRREARARLEERGLLVSFKNRMKYFPSSKAHIQGRKRDSKGRYATKQNIRSQQQFQSQADLVFNNTPASSNRYQTGT